MRGNLTGDKFYACFEGEESGRFQDDSRTRRGGVARSVPGDNGYYVVVVRPKQRGRGTEMEEIGQAQALNQATSRVRMEGM